MAVAAGVSTAVTPAGGEPAARERVRDLPRRALVALGAILLVAFALRAWGALHPEASPGPDADAYAALARSLYEHQSYGSSDWSPGAPLLFSAVYYLTGGVHPWAARLVVAALGTLMVLF